MKKTAEFHVDMPTLIYFYEKVDFEGISFFNL